MSVAVLLLYVLLILRLPQKEAQGLVRFLPHCAYSRSAGQAFAVSAVPFGFYVITLTLALIVGGETFWIVDGAFSLAICCLGAHSVWNGLPPRKLFTPSSQPEERKRGLVLSIAQPAALAAARAARPKAAYEETVFSCAALISAGSATPDTPFVEDSPAVRQILEEALSLRNQVDEHVRDAIAAREEAREAVSTSQRLQEKISALEASVTKLTEALQAARQRTRSSTFSTPEAEYQDLMRRMQELERSGTIAAAQLQRPLDI